MKNLFNLSTQEIQDLQDRGFATVNGVALSTLLGNPDPALTLDHAIDYCRIRPQLFDYVSDAKIFDDSVKILREAKRNLQDTNALFIYKW